MEKCPHCGSENGAYTTYTGKQYYDWDGEPCGFNADVPDNQRAYVRCVDCGKRVAKARLVRKERPNA